MTTLRSVPVIAVGPVSAGEVVDLRHRVLRPGRPRQDAIWTGDDEPGTRHWAAQDGGEIVGVASVLCRDFPEDPALSRFQLRGMAVASDRQGRGIGAGLLAFVLAAVGASMWCNARIRAAGLYERAGFRVVGDPFDIAGIGPHLRMICDQSVSSKS